MKQYFLAEITTKDHLVHQGIYWEPKKKGKSAILWVHGLTSTFYGDLLIFEKIVNRAEKYGIGFASFNTRGHDMIAGLRTVDPSKDSGFGHMDGGAGREVFEDSVHDIDAGIIFLIKQGFNSVIIAGHSTGANKCCFYAGTQKDKRVAGVVLAGPISDRYTEYGKQPWYIIYLLKFFQKIGRGHIPLNGLGFFPVSPDRLLSLTTPGSHEDVFNYGDQEPKLQTFSRIKQPVFVVLSENDEYKDRPIEEIQKAFDSHAFSKRYASVIIPNALHGYEGQEDEFAKIVVEWVSGLDNVS